MKEDFITIVEIDSTDRLHIKPGFEKFTMIYRTATEVHWDNEKSTLYSPKPRDWSYLEWYLHIVGVAKSEWINISEDLKNKITKAQQGV